MIQGYLARVTFDIRRTASKFVCSCTYLDAAEVVCMFPGMEICSSLGILIATKAVMALIERRAERDHRAREHSWRGEQTESYHR